MRAFVTTPVLVCGLTVSLLLPGCSDEAQIEETRSQQERPKQDTERLSSATECQPESALRLVNDQPATYHSPAVQGVVMFCSGCHGQVDPRAGIDMSDYTRMITTFAQRNVQLSRILQQVQNDHQYSRDSSLEIVTAWHQNSYARGSSDGSDSDSPFFDGKSGDNGIDLKDFDPFASDDLEVDEAPSVSARCP